MYDENFQEQTGKTFKNGGSADPSYGKKQRNRVKKNMVWRTADDQPYLLSSDKTNILTAAGIQFPDFPSKQEKATSKGIEFDLNGNIQKEKLEHLVQLCIYRC